MYKAAGRWVLRPGGTFRHVKHHFRVASFSSSQQQSSTGKSRSHHSHAAIHGITGFVALGSVFFFSKTGHADTVSTPQEPSTKSDGKQQPKEVPPSAEQEKIDWREKYKGNYNNRIRDLSTPEKIFSTFASVKGADARTWYMTVDDFAKAILPFDHRSDESKGTIDSTRVPDFFKLADIDQDGLISQSEYVMFSTLLGIREDQVETAFRMFDLDGNGVVDIDEFRAMMEVMRPQSLTGFSFKHATAGASMMTMFFGQDGQGTLDSKRFSKFIRDLRRILLEMEFARYDKYGTGKITARNFAMSIIGYCKSTEIEGYKKRLNTLKVEGYVSKKSFFDFNRVLPNIDKIQLSLNLYSASKNKISKADFQRAVYAVTGVVLTPVQTDVLFHVFDRDGNGSLDHDDLIGALKHRYQHNLGHHRDVGFARFLKCCFKCMSRDK